MFTCESIRVKNHMNVTCAANRLVSRELCIITCENTREISHMRVHCVANVSVTPATCSYINVVSTAAQNQFKTTGRLTDMSYNTDGDAKLYSCTHCLDGFERCKQLGVTICWSHSVKILD